MAHDHHPHESPKRVYFGIPIAFALSFWFIVFLSLKACDHGHENACDAECSKECVEKCKAGGKDCPHECAKHSGRNVPEAAHDAPDSKEEEKGKAGEHANDADRKIQSQEETAREASNEAPSKKEDDGHKHEETNK